MVLAKRRQRHNGVNLRKKEMTKDRDMEKRERVMNRGRRKEMRVNRYMEKRERIMNRDLGK